MTTRRLLIESIRHYWRTHLGVITGTALAALVLTGALMVGDSVKATLREQALARMGKIGEALLCGERLVPWPREVEKRPSVVARTFVPGPDAAGVLMLTGSASASEGSARANMVQIVGVDAAFWKLSPSGNDPFSSDGTPPHGAPPVPAATSLPREAPQKNAAKNAAAPNGNVATGTDGAPPRVVLNERLAAQLGVKVGDEVLLRMEKPSAISKDAPLSGDEDAAIMLRARVARVVGDADFGRFSLASGQVPPFTAFVPLAALQEKLGVGEKVNILMRRHVARTEQNGSGNAKGSMSAIRKLFSSTTSTVVMDLDEMGLLAPDNSDAAIRQLFGQYDLRLIELPHSSGIGLRTPRIFLEPAIVKAARANERATSPDAAGIGNPPRGLDSLTYFVNELRAGDGSDAKARATPYSMVTAIDAPASGFVNPKLADDEIQITRWLADDLGVAPGAKVTVKYFVMGERRQLVEKARTFTVAEPIFEMTEPQLNGSWMPDFPGLSDKENCRDWKPGFDFDATRMRDKDQDYWKQYRGTPKAFVTVRTGQEMWGNRWGNLTSIRYPAGTKREQVERIAAFIDPAALGFRTVNLREQALAATNAPVDFGELFVYFSFFLIAAAAVLTGLLFTFTIEQRAAEAGLLLAVGWPVQKVRRLFLREGFVLALIGSLAGALLAALYTKGVLHALASVWSGATGGTRFVFAPSAVT
ncbi:MAG: FtsX-like permease family protein, partial [Chthoniobacteraceae bacterium]